LVVRERQFNDHAKTALAWTSLCPDHSLVELDHTARYGQTKAASLDLFGTDRR
jgi:hypothetical protein